MFFPGVTARAESIKISLAYIQANDVVTVDKITGISLLVLRGKKAVYCVHGINDVDKVILAFSAIQ